MQGVISDKYAENDPPEYTCYGKEDDEDDYGGDYGDYGDEYGEEGEDPYAEADRVREIIKNEKPVDGRFLRVG